MSEEQKIFLKKPKIEKEEAEENRPETEQQEETDQGSLSSFDIWGQLPRDVRLYTLSFLSMYELLLYGECSKESLKESRDPILWGFRKFKAAYPDLKKTLKKTGRDLPNLDEQRAKAIKGLVLPHKVTNEDLISLILSCPSIEEIRFEGWAKLSENEAIDIFINQCPSLKFLEIDPSFEMGVERLKIARPEMVLFEPEEEEWEDEFDEEDEEDEWASSDDYDSEDDSNSDDEAY